MIINATPRGSSTGLQLDTLASDLTVPEGSAWHVASDLTVSDGVTLTVAGTAVVGTSQVSQRALDAVQAEAESALAVVAADVETAQEDIENAQGVAEAAYFAAQSAQERADEALGVAGGKFPISVYVSNLASATTIFTACRNAIGFSPTSTSMRYIHFDVWCINQLCVVCGRNDGSWYENWATEGGSNLSWSLTGSSDVIVLGASVRQGREV